MKLTERLHRLLFPFDYALKQLKKEMKRKNVEMERYWQMKYPDLYGG